MIFICVILIPSCLSGTEGLWFQKELMFWEL